MVTTKDLIAGVIIMVLLIAGCTLENWRDRKRMTKEEQQAAQTWLLATSAAFLVMALLLALFAHPVHAHDHDRPDLSNWYKDLKSGRGPCCDGSESEVKHLSDVEWRTHDGHYQVFINQYMDGSGESMWVDVPDEAVINEPNRDGRTTVWPIWGTQPRVRCFLPGRMT